MVLGEGDVAEWTSEASFHNLLHAELVQVCVKHKA